MKYPIKFDVGRDYLTELYYCEEGRYEDAQNARKAGDEETIVANNYQLVLCDFLDRYKTIIEIRNDAELVEFYYALVSGTIGLRRLTKTNRLLGLIADDVQRIAPEQVARWGYYNNGF